MRKGPNAASVTRVGENECTTLPMAKTRLTGHEDTESVLKAINLAG